MLEPGTLIGRYEIQRRLGRGGMGAVYVAHDPQLGRMVAIKFLRDEIEGPEALERFEREAKSAASLNHPNVVTVHDFNGAEAQPYLVMEYVPGRTLAEVIRKKEPIAIGEKLRWIEELCAGAGYAHRMSVVHRDIKPANLIIARSGQLKILDFGIARMMGNTSNTASGIGTPAYMAPEQITGEPIDHRADLFAIGVVCYELISCREAFSGENTEAIKHNVLTRQPVPLSQLVVNLHADLIAIVERAIQKDRNQRYPDAESMRSALASVRRALEANATQGFVPTLVSPGLAGGRPSDAGAGSVRPSGSAGSQGTPHSASRPRRDKEALARTALERSRTLFEQRNLDEALQQCHITLSIDEGHPDALAFEQTIQSALDQREADALLEQGSQFLSRGALTEARGCLERARVLATDVGPLKRLERQLSHLEVEQKRLTKRAETVAGMVRSAQVALAAGQIQEALASAREALSLDPTCGPAREVEREAVRLLEGTGPMSPIEPPGLTSTPTLVRPAASPGSEPTVFPSSPVTPPRPQTPFSPAPARPTAAASTSTVRRDPLARARPVLEGIGPALARAGHSLRDVALRARASVPDAKALTAWPPRGKALAVWGVVGAAIVGGVVAALVLRPTVEVPTGGVVVDAVPWGTITAITRENGDSVPLPVPATTPVLLTLPAGAYRILLSGPDSGPERTITVRVEPGGTGVAPVERFPTPGVDEYFAPFLSVPEVAPDGAADPSGASPSGVAPPQTGSEPGLSR